MYCRHSEGIRAVVWPRRQLLLRRCREGALNWLLLLNSRVETLTLITQCYRSGSKALFTGSIHVLVIKMAAKIPSYGRQISAFITQQLALACE